MRSLKDISWNISEEDYRKDPALSYSTLARFNREGFNNLNKLFDKIETPSLTFGSAVDSIITGGMEEFNERFIVADFPEIPDSIVKIVKRLFNSLKDRYTSLVKIPNDDIIYITQEESYQLNWKPETRAKVIKEKGSEYYDLLYIAGDKTILDTQTYLDVINSVDALKTNTATKYYFAEDNPYTNIRRYYQLKFKSIFDDINYRCMMDLAVVDYDNKTIIPVDLKTSSHAEWEFYKSFKEWNYQIQARLYWRILKDNLEKDEYFKDFKLLDYIFIVVNRKTLTPLVWKFPLTSEYGTLKFGKNSQIEMRDPFDLGKELSSYLKYNPRVPKGINMVKSNNIEEWLNTL